MKLFQKMAIGVTAVAGLATMGITAAQAATPTARANPMSSLVSAIAEKFHLSQSDVQQVFDQQRTLQESQMKEKHAEMLKTRLAQAVTDGKLTQAQADAITAKQAEIQTFMEGLKDASEADRRAAIKIKMDEVKAWATQNAIPEPFMVFGRGFMERNKGLGERMGGKGEFKGHRGENEHGRFGHKGAAIAPAPAANK